MPRYLTKSRFKLACECPTKLFYTGKSSYYDASKEDDFLAMLADGGYQVGALAKLRFPDGIEIHGLEHQKALDDTNALLKTNERVVLFEPAIRFGNCFIRIDVLVKDGQNFELVEVKAKSFNSERPNERLGKNGQPKSDMLPYILDAAFQTWVLRSAIPGARVKTFLMMPDKAKVAEIDGINQMFKIDSEHRDVEVRIPDGVDGQQIAETLLAKVDVTFQVEQILDGEIAFPGGQGKLDALAASWAEAYVADKKIEPTIGAQCGNCQFKNDPNGQLRNGRAECWSAVTGLSEDQLASGTVLDIWNFRGKQKLIDQGVYKISQVQRDDLGDFDDAIGPEGLSTKQRQWLQISGLPDEYKDRGYYIDERMILSESQTWKFPYHFIDFETASVALPFHKLRPYEQVAFQFSHHVMEADGSIRHAGQFLSTTPGEFPNFKFARALRDELAGDDGTVFMWSPHENTILSRILKQLADSDEPDRDELGEFVASLLKGQSRAMYDLCALASKAYFHPMTKGSNSIKKVLPSILSSSAALCEKYSKPIYGAPGGIPSLNFSSETGFAWLEPDLPGGLDPYQKLKVLAKDMLPPGVDEDGSVIAEGGAAATAYSRLQFEDLDPDARGRIEANLLKYCELDTMSMQIVLQGWFGNLTGSNVCAGNAFTARKYQLLSN